MLPGWYHLWDWRARGFEEGQEKHEDGDVGRAKRQKIPYREQSALGCVFFCLEDVKEM